MADSDRPERSEAIAVIGMAGRFPGAHDVEEFWSNLCRGVEAIVPLSDAVVRQAVGADMRNDSGHVKVAAALADIDRFDAEYFQFTPRLAEIHDPQHRVLLEVAEEALQDAGYVGALVSGDTGVFVGVGSSGYAREHLFADPQLVRAVGAHQIYLATEKDFAPVLVAYKLGLTGPAAAVNCGCSSSLVSIHLAASSLLDRECDLALAGGCAIIANANTGYRYREGGILSPDGHCRPFDAAAGGTVPASAVGIVVLKRLEEALADGDHVEAVILGSAINNDGSDKIGFTAPSVNGQVRVVANALAVAGVAPSEIGYIEAHGTATPLGDPVEVAALREVFGNLPQGTCYLGAVKSNIGHSNAASGVVGFIKTVLSVKHGLVPPTLHFRTPNPELCLPDSAFTINSELRPWRSDGAVRRAGVSSFGIGGTNAHVVVGEPPRGESPPSARQWHVLPLSAKHPDSLLNNRARLERRIESAPDLNLADVAFTLQTGRAHARYRCAVVATSREDAATQLRQPYTATAACTDRLPVVLMFPGQGAQHPGMTAGLYRHEPEFREQIDRCAQLLAPALEQDIRCWILPQHGTRREPEALADTLLAQPLIFSTSYALARLLQSYGVEIAGMLGHSLGEYVAACLAGVFSLEEALALIVQRARLMQSTQPGAMLAVSATQDEAAHWSSECDIAAVNGANAIVLAGQRGVISGLHDFLTQRGRECRLLDVNRAFHSPLMEPIRDELVRAVARVELRPPQRRYVSNLSGTWIEERQAVSAVYWGEHLRAPVRFAAGLATVLSEDVALIECGPGRTLSSLARRHPDAQRARCIASLCRHPQDSIEDAKCFAGALAQMWSVGVELDWKRMWRDERRRRVSLPPYAFRKERYWVEPPLRSTAQSAAEGTWYRAALSAPADAAAPFEVADMAREMQQGLDRAVEAAANDADVGLNAELEALCLDYVVHALRQLGMSFARGSRFECDELAGRLQVQQSQRRQFEHLLAMLAGAGVLGRDDRRWSVLVEPAHCTPSQRMRALVSRSPELDFQLSRCDRLWSAIAAYLTGKADLREAMLASDGLSGTSRFYAEPPEKRLVNSLIANALAQWLAHLAPGRAVRIIEIGAGTGGTTAAILEALPRERIEFVFTDKSRFFFGSARERFGRSADAITYAALDIEKDPLVQGFARHSFDIAVAANVLHATRDLRGSLANARALLRPGGLLIVLEATERLRATDLTYGFLKEWWEFKDGELRGNHPLADCAAWCSALTQSGFRDVAAVRPSSARVPFQHTIFAASVGSAPRADKMLLLAESLTSGASHARVLARYGFDVVVVAPAQRYQRHDSCTFSVDPGESRDLKRLIEDLQEHGSAPVSQVMYAWPLALHGDCSVAELDERLHTYLSALGHLCDCLQRYGGAPELTIRVVTRGVCCTDSAATVLGATQAAIVREAQRLAGLHARWRWQYIDLDDDRTADEQRVALEASSETSAQEVRYHGGERWVRGAEVPSAPVTRPSEARAATQIVDAPAAAESGLSAAIAEIWRSVLGAEHLDPGSDFFALGGDSLTAMQLVSRLRDELGVEIRVRQFLERPTIQAVVEMIEALRAPAARSELPPDAGACTPDDAQPVSLEQRRILFLESTSKDLGTLFSIPIAVRIRGELDAARLRFAFEQIARRHSVLRARFAIADGVARQYIGERGGIDIRIVDASQWDEARQAVELEQQAARPFDLSTGPLVRVQIMKCRGEEHLLLVNMHHIISDSWSMAIVGRELSAFYDGAARPPDLPVQYTDYIRWQERFVASEELQTQLRFWQQRLAGAPITQSLPADRPRPATRSFRGDVLTFTLPAELSAQIRALARENGSTLFVALLAVFAVLVHAETETEEVLVGTDTANRCRSEFEQLIGFFINVIALRISLQGNPDFLAILAQARNTTYEAFANQSAPFDRVVASLKEARVPRFAPLFQMKFLMQNTPTAPFRLGETQIMSVPVRRAASELDLIFSMRESRDGVQGLIEYGTDLFDAQTVRRFAEEYAWLAGRCVADVHGKLSEIVAELRRWQAERRTAQQIGNARCLPSIARARKVVRAAG